METTKAADYTDYADSVRASLRCFGTRVLAQQRHHHGMEFASKPPDPLTYAIIGAAMDVHAVLGPGFLESVYRDALCVELIDRGLEFRTEVTLPVFYKGKVLTSLFRADVICSAEVLVELKAIAKIGEVEVAQVINYLKASGLSRGLLFNFGARSLQFRRLVLSTLE